MMGKAKKIRFLGMLPLVRSRATYADLRPCLKAEPAGALPDAPAGLLSDPPDKLKAPHQQPRRQGHFPA